MSKYYTNKIEKDFVLDFEIVVDSAVIKLIKVPLLTADYILMYSSYTYK